MKFWQIGCGGAIILAVVFLIYVIIATIRDSIRDKKLIADLMRRNGWLSPKNPGDEVAEWVKPVLQTEPDRYTVFGSVSERGFYRRKMFISNLWTKQDGDKIYFVLNVSDHYSKGGSNANFTIIGMRLPQMSLPFFTLFPKIEFPKSKGWLDAISGTHDLNFIDSIDFGKQLARQKFVDDLDDWKNNRLTLPSLVAEETTAPVPRAIDPPITIDSSSFNERFELYGKESERIRQFFDNEKLTALESMPQTFVDGGGELIFVYIPEHQPKAKDFEKYINDGIAIITSMSRGVINNNSHQ